MDKLELGLRLINDINNLGYDAYIVGGAVRDYLLKANLSDIDITTNIPFDVINKNFKTINKIENPYLSNKIEYENQIFELTNFRKDVSYKKHRHPVVVKVDSIKYDLKRRDFTINAFLMDNNKKIYDYYNGFRDLDLKIIKTIHRANKRMNEDSLRIFRAIYFALKLDFKIETNTFKAMKKYSSNLRYLSLYSITNELDKLFSLQDFKLFYYFKKLKIKNIFPEFKKTLYFLEAYNYIPKSSFEFYVLVTYYNNSLLSYNYSNKEKAKLRLVLNISNLNDPKDVLKKYYEMSV